jgi:cellulase/cellobiase CelA1
MMRRLLLAVITAVLLLAAIVIPAAANAATATPSCTGDISIGQFPFSPASVPAGQTSTLTLAARNCTSQTVAGQTVWFGQYTWSGPGVPPGCPAIDPALVPYTLSPGAVTTTTAQDGDTIPGCPATGLQVTVQFTVSDVGTVAQATADLTIVQPAPPLACQVTYTPDIWPGGFTATVAVSNTGPAAFNGWTLSFSFPGDEHITNVWNATVTQTGSSVSAANLSYNATIPPGGSQSFGFQGTWTSDDASPATFSVNGVQCA